MATQTRNKIKSFNQASQGQATIVAKDGSIRFTLGGLVQNYKKNFLSKSIKIVDGLEFNQYDTLRRIYLYSHGVFESGDTDDQGNPKFFYDLVTHRADQAKKNIDLDTKDVYIKSEGGEMNMLRSWLLRKEFMGYAKETHFGEKLNDMSDDLPVWGTVVWKKIDDEEVVHQVELINLMNDPGVKHLKDSSLTIERHIMTAEEMYEMKSWNKEAVEAIIAKGRHVSPQSFMTVNGAVNAFANVIDEVTPTYEVYEVWGMLPENVFDKEDVPNPDPKKRRYGMGLVGNIEEGSREAKLFVKPTTKDQFPYKSVHMRRKKGRYLGYGYTEALFSLTEKANELTNRFYQGLRIGAMHLYQTRNKGFIRNVLSDLEDGDIIETPNELTPIPTEIRAFQQYQQELNNIERQADKICNSFESVTGENMPSGTPFRLGAQQMTSATKLFDRVKQDEGLFVEYAFNEWILPRWAEKINMEHTLELLGDVDDLQQYYAICDRIKQWNFIKNYIIAESEFPSPEELQTVMAVGPGDYDSNPKPITVEKDFYRDQKYSLKVVTTGENEAKKANLESMFGLAQTIIANPAALQDDRVMKLVQKITESSGALSPIDINLISRQPTNPQLNPANQGGGGADNLAAATAPPGAEEQVPA